MKREKQPWTDERGFPLADGELKIVCQSWDEKTWSAYLKAYENKNGKGNLLSSEDYDCLAENLKESIFDFSMPSASPELQQLVQNALSQLTDKQAQIISKIFWEGRTQHQVALDLGICQSSISKTKQRALDALRKILQGGINSPIVKGQKNPGQQKGPSTRDEEIRWVMNQEINRQY